MLMQETTVPMSYLRAKPIGIMPMLDQGCASTNCIFEQCAPSVPGHETWLLQCGQYNQLCVHGASD